MLMARGPRPMLSYSHSTWPPSLCSRRRPRRQPAELSAERLLKRIDLPSNGLAQLKALSISRGPWPPVSEKALGRKPIRRSWTLKRTVFFALHVKRVMFGMGT